MSRETLPEENPQQEFVFPGWEEKMGKKLVPGYHYDEKGEIVDWEGKTYDKNDNLKSTPASSPLENEIELLKKTRPELANNREALTTLARINISARKNGVSYETTPYPPLDD
jgi:hypothetical protein